MKGTVLLVTLLGMSVLRAAEYDYFSANRESVRNGVQAVLMCNGLFTSGRTHDIVRRGVDYGRQGFNRWALTREVLKAFD